MFASRCFPPLGHSISSAGDHRVFAQPEGQRQIALRAVARSAVHHAPLLAGRAFNAHHGADAVAIGFRARQPHRQPVILIAAIVAKQIGGAVVGGDQHVEVAVVIEIGIGRAARHHRRG